MPRRWQPKQTMAKDDSDFNPYRLDAHTLAKRRVPERRVLTAKQRREREHFVMVPLELAHRVCRATGEGATFMVLWLLYRSWKTGSPTVKFADSRLEAQGVSRWTKQRALRKLERAGIVSVKRGHGRAPAVTLLPLADETKDGSAQVDGADLLQ